MARFLLTSGAKFTPFTYDELVKPLAQMAEAHANTQTALDTMATEAGALAAQIGSGEETERSRALYENYMKQLQATSDDLYLRGYGTSAMRGLSKARAMYGSDIGKIQQAIKQRDARADEYRKAVAANPTLITEYNPLTKGLDNWLDNPQYGYYQSYSGETLINQGKLIGDNLRKEMLRDEQTWRHILGGQYFERLVRSGYTSEELMNALNNVMEGKQSTNPAEVALEQAISQVYNSTGMQSWASPVQRARALNYIGQGMTSAIGEVKTETQQDHDHMTPYQSASLALQNRHQQFEELKWTAEQEAKAAAAGTGYITPTAAVESTAEKAKDWSKDKGKYFKGPEVNTVVKTKDGRTLTVHNWQEATSLVYNGAARDKGFEIFNFDIAQDPMNWIQSTNSRQYGKTVLNGKEYNVRTGPAERNGWRSGINNDVAIYVETSPGHWGLHKGLTKIYNDLRQEIKDSTNYYKTNYREVYNAALNPDAEQKLRDRYDVPANVPTTGLSQAIDASPMTSRRISNQIILAQSGDNGKAVREQLLSQLSANYDLIEAQLTDSQMKRSSSYSIRPVKDGVISFSGKGKSPSIFKKNSKGEIENVSDIRVTPESLQDGMFLVTTTDGQYAVPAAMFGNASAAYAERMKQMGATISACLNNASYLANASVTDTSLVRAADLLSRQTNQLVNPADLRDLLSTQSGRESLRKYYNQAIMDSVPLLLGSTVRFSRFPAASLTASKDPQ